MKQQTTLEEVINEVHKLEVQLGTDLQEALQRELKLDVEYCENCDSYRIDSCWHENSRGDCICQGCYESIVDRAHEMRNEYQGDN